MLSTIYKDFFFQIFSYFIVVTNSNKIKWNCHSIGTWPVLSCISMHSMDISGKKIILFSSFVTLGYEKETVEAL